MRLRILSALRKAPVASWHALGASTGATAASIVICVVERPGAGRVVDDLWTTLVLLGGLWLASAFETFLARPRAYYVVHAVRILLLLELMPYVASNPQIALLCCGAAVMSICLFDPYPWSLAVALAAVVLTAVLRFVCLVTLYEASGAAAAMAILTHLLLGILVAGLGSQFVRRRQELVEARRDVRRLDSTVIGLTRANLQYQDFASEAEEIAMESERKRITRDIHDVVGYTLTNNIMLMEAATDMMERNPFGVPSLIGTARENAKEGLAQIRESLYALRKQGVMHPTGLRALARMVRVYERATGVHVQAGFGTANWNYPEEVDSTIYHLVQEALMNSFRHGKARNVGVIVAERESEIAVSVRDDGMGAWELEEGIGIKGMRERLSRLGGSVTVDGEKGGFLVRATIPLQKGEHGTR